VARRGRAFSRAGKGLVRTRHLTGVSRRWGWRKKHPKNKGSRGRNVTEIEEAWWRKGACQLLVQFVLKTRKRKENLEKTLEEEERGGRKSK